MDTRSLVDCQFFLRGSCTKGGACPFKHDPAKITSFRQQQGLQDCLFFLQGRCSKGSLCPFRHDPAKLPQHLQAAGSGGTGAALASPPPSVTVDFGPGDAQQQPQQPAPAAASQRAAAAARPVPAAIPAAAAVAPLVRQQTAAAAPKPRQPPQQEQPSVSRKTGPNGAPSAAGGAPAVAAAPAGGIPSRLAGRLGPALPPSSEPQTRGRSQSATRTSEQEHASDGGVSGRAPRRRAAGALGVALSALQGALGADPVHDAAGNGKADARMDTAVQRKRRMGSGSDGQVGAGEADQQRVRTPAAKRAAASTGGLSKPRAVPATATKPATAAPALQQQQQEAQPKNIEEIRREKRLQRFAPLQGSKAATEAQPAAPKPSGSGRKHAPIVFQPEQPSPPVASPTVSGATKQPMKAAAPIKQPAVRQQAKQPFAEQPTAVSKHSGPQKLQEAAAAEQKQQAAQAAQHKPADEELKLDDEDFDFEGLEGMDVGGDGGADDEDDFEAQMRALEEGL